VTELLVSNTQIGLDQAPFSTKGLSFAFLKKISGWTYADLKEYDARTRERCN